MHGRSCCWKHRLPESLRVKAGTAQPAFILFLEFVFLLRWKAILKETLTELKPQTPAYRRTKQTRTISCCCFHHLEILQAKLDIRKMQQTPPVPSFAVTIGSCPSSISRPRTGDMGSSSQHLPQRSLQRIITTPAEFYCLFLVHRAALLPRALCPCVSLPVSKNTQCLRSAEGDLSSEWLFLHAVLQ